MSLLKKHWQKFILAAFASFWTGCLDDASTEPEDLYGCPYPESSESQESTESSNSEGTYGSSEQQLSSSSVNSSSSRNDIYMSSMYGAPMYGVMPPSSTSKPSPPENCIATTVYEAQSPACYDEICPDYGVEYVEARGCKCDDGNTYTLQEYASLFDVTALQAIRDCGSGSASSSSSEATEVNSSSTQDESNEIRS